MRYSASALLAMLIAAALPSAALAQASWNYTLKVPVKVTNAPSGASVIVTCFLYNGANHSGGNLGEGEGPSSNPQVGKDGKYEGTLAVRLSTATQAGSWACTLQLASNSSIINSLSGGWNIVNAPGWSGTLFATGNF
jgi:hypothetical protein